MASLATCRQVDGGRAGCRPDTTPRDRGSAVAKLGPATPVAPALRETGGNDPALLYNPAMSPTADPAGWNILPPATLPPEERLGHVRGCSDFAAQLLDRFPDWIDGLDEPGVPTITTLSSRHAQ